MYEDVRSVTPDDNKGGIADGDVTVFDMHTFSLRHITKIVISSLRVYMKYTQEAHCLRIKHLHIVNCSPLVNKIMFLVKPFIRKDVYDMVGFPFIIVSIRKLNFCFFSDSLSLSKFKYFR